MTVVRKFTVNEERITDLVQLMRRNFPPDLFLREYTKNCIQAIQRLLEKKEGRITIDANDFLEMQGLKKICFTDNGCGMNLDEMRKFINQLSSSHKKEADQERFGIGAKISAITDNKEGIYYESWKEGKGTAVLLGYDPNSNEYGLKKLGNGEDHLILDPGAKPKVIDKHGTRVTLFGNSHNQNTMLKPENISGSMEAWIYYNLNKRFFKLPENIKIQVRIGYHRPKEDTQHNYLANLKGQKESLDRSSDHSGTKDVSGAKIHWWIMNESKKEGHGREFLTGHSATLFENELTGYGIGKSNLSKYFGIVFGFSNVIIYIEPDKDTHKYDMGRKEVVRKDGSAVEVHKWAAEFYKNMPEQLKEYEDKQSNAGDTNDVKDIKKQLKQYMKYFDVSKYQRRSDGLEENVIESGNFSGGYRSGSSETTKEPTLGENPGKTEELVSVCEDIQKRKEKVKKERVDPFPNPIWVTNQEPRKDDEGRREDGEMEDKLAEYFEVRNIIKINMDFQGYKDLLRQSTEELDGLADPDALKSSTITVVRSEIVKMLLQHVAYCKYLKNRNQFWRSEEFEKMISPEALTCILSQKVFLIPQIRRMLKNKLGISNQKIEEAKNSRAL